MARTPRRASTPRRIGPRNPRAASNRGENRGVTPYRTVAEQQFADGAETTAQVPGVRSQPSHSRRDINAAIDAASQRLSPEKAEALRNAQWLGPDASGLMDVRPTNTSDDTRPRTLAAGYDEQSKTLFVLFRGKHQGGYQYADGVGYEYYNVSPREWSTFANNWSPGRYINAALNGKPYTPATWGATQ